MFELFLCLAGNQCSYYFKQNLPPLGHVCFSLLSELEIHHCSVSVSSLHIQHLLHLVWSTQQFSAQRDHILFAGKTEIQRGPKRTTLGNTSQDNHEHLQIHGLAQTEINCDCKNHHTRKPLLRRYLTIILYDVIQRNKTIWRYIHI